MSQSDNTRSQDDSNTKKVSYFFAKPVREKIEQHPCYSKNASQYARMHLPVAPACNIQCNYCNRKYDCSNESRPGVVSKLTDPTGATTQYAAVAKRSEALTVVGIAGPGDALANPQATFATLRKVKLHNPEVQLCISTNGLMLADYVEELRELGVDHLTITINCIDPTIGMQIYPWVFYDHRRLRGYEAASTLIRRQLEGLSLAAKAGMLVKVNTVLIPGINDHHIETVANEVQRLGAMLHNIMPLISEPEHGTYFGLNGIKGPNEQQLEHARKVSGAFMPQMTHCQQCRADAVGTLGESCSANSSSNVMPVYRVAIATKSDNLLPVIDTHFGYADQFELYDYDTTTRSFIHCETRKVSKYCQGSNGCDTEEQYKIQLLEALHDVNELFCSRIGITPWRQLEKQGVTPNVDYAFSTHQEALQATATRICQMLLDKELKHVRNYG
ncbi:nitrogenase cofactor biosynthesis protein NifB [Vibrio sp. qd031]|uniref:nitrogenase cofactor biosynthesis protein NifB n=1 Tax=Vibrio sp. qd031 TaxID=1603038 RepID=UPI000A11DBCA|nr:nitrogenase cofactor biosynthesis protein NifB [Vibrio sp. qd031]